MGHAPVFIFDLPGGLSGDGIKQKPRHGGDVEDRVIASAEVEIDLKFGQIYEVRKVGRRLFVTVYRKAEIYEGGLTVLDHHLGRGEIVMGHVLAMTILENIENTDSHVDGVVQRDQTVLFEIGLQGLKGSVRRVHVFPAPGLEKAKRKRDTLIDLSTGYMIVNSSIYRQGRFWIKLLLFWRSFIPGGFLSDPVEEIARLFHGGLKT